MASEITPLLPATNINVRDDFPPILSAAQRLPPNPSLFDFENLYPHSLGHAQPLRALAFRLLLVLHLLTNHNNLSRGQNTIKAFHVSHDQDRCRENLRDIASAILNHVPGAIAEASLPGAIEGVPEDISVEHILLAPFPRDSISPQTLRVIDRLAHPAVPTEILNNPIISLSLIRLWRYGEASLVPLPSESTFRRMLKIYDASSTPRSVHAVHMTAHLVYLALLSHLILYPSPRPILVDTPGGPIGLREPIIAIYSISNICFTPFSSSFPHVFVLFSFLISLPTSPSPGAIAYTLLVLALCLHILFLQFPGYPTLPLLFEPTRWLPLSSLYLACVMRYLLPALVLSLPVLLGSTVLLSLSLSGPSVNPQAIGPTPSAPPSAFLILFCIGCFLSLYLSISTLLLSPSPFCKDEIRCDWERYGVGFGVVGRRSLIRAILTYSPSRHPLNLAYPPPLNILSLPLAFLPVLPRQVYKFFLRLVVSPVAFVAAGLWGWGRL